VIGLGRRATALVLRIRSEAIFRGSMDLLLNTVILAGFGFVFWAVAARTFPATDIGVASAISSASGLLSIVAALGLPNTMLRHLASTREARALARGVLLGVLALGSLLCLAFVLVVGPRLPASLHLREQGAGVWLLVALVVVSSSSAIVDAGLIAVRGTSALVVKGLVGSIAKVIALPLCQSLGATGVILALVIGAAISTLMGVRALWRRLPPLEHHVSTVGIVRRYMAFSAGNYVGTVFGTLPMTVVPLIVVASCGTREAAWYVIAFMLVSFLNFIPATTSQVLFAEISRAPEAVWWHLRKGLQGIYSLLVPCAIVVVVAGPYVLGIFGPDYRSGASSALRLLALSTLFTGGTYLVDSLLAANDYVKSYILMNIVNAALVIAGVALVIGRGLTWVAGAWCTAQAISLAFGVLLLLVLLRRRRRPPREDLVAVLQRLADEHRRVPALFSS
jgi:O-antigen/teichoic acid export membrane protein